MFQAIGTHLLKKGPGGTLADISHQLFGTATGGSRRSDAPLSGFDTCVLSVSAAIVIFLGAIVARSEALKYAIPAPVISGLIFSIIVSPSRVRNRRNLLRRQIHEGSLPELILPLCVGFGFSAKMLTRRRVESSVSSSHLPCVSSDHLSGPLRIRMSPAHPDHPLLALSVLPAAMSGGVGTASALTRSLRMGRAGYHRCWCRGRYHGKYHAGSLIGGRLQRFPDRKARQV